MNKLARLLDRHRDASDLYQEMCHLHASAKEEGIVHIRTKDVMFSCPVPYSMVEKAVLKEIESQEERVKALQDKIKKLEDLLGDEH